MNDWRVATGMVHDGLLLGFGCSGGLPFVCRRGSKGDGQEGTYRQLSCAIRLQFGPGETEDTSARMCENNKWLMPAFVFAMFVTE